jgi:hypothetical protein
MVWNANIGQKPLVWGPLQNSGSVSFVRNIWACSRVSALHVVAKLIFWAILQQPLWQRVLTEDLEPGAACSAGGANILTCRF